MWIKSVMPFLVEKKERSENPTHLPFLLDLVLRKEQKEKNHKHEVLQESNKKNLAL